MKKLILPLIALVVIAGVAAVVATTKMSEQKAENVTNVSSAAEKDVASNPAAQPTEASSSKGRYEEYSADKIAVVEYTDTILFFYAAWCPECRSFKQAITTQEIPNNVQILEVNYDKATDLRKQYGVTLQSTFVKVDDTGKQLSKWVGYGKNKSLQTVLSNL